MAKGKARPAPPKGNWLATFNDLMTLLLTFFVLLLTMGSLEGGKTKKMYTELRGALGVLGGGSGEETQVFEPILPVLKIGKRKKVVENLYRVEEDQEASPGEDALRQKETPANVVVKPIQTTGEIGDGETSDTTDTEYRKIPPLPEEVIRRKKLMAGAEDLKQETPGLSFEIRDEDTVAISVPQVFLFEMGSAELKGEASKILDRIAGFLNRNPELGIVVEGHTDNIPIRTARFPSNWELSVARAVNVLNILRERSDLGPDRFAAVGYGDSRPVNTEDTPEARAENRRVAILLSYDL
ncbi:MAG: OmpA family protein [Deltaproteobacteria bacterium]|nr:OmpA family protein [Deltaproteobacteria bacterium]